MEDPLINNPISGTIIWGTDISGAFFSGDWNSFAYGMGGATVLGLEVYAGAGVANKINTPRGKGANGYITNDILQAQRTGKALKIDTYHSFSNIVDNYAGMATKTNIKNGTLYQLQGSLDGTLGRFEWIIQSNGQNAGMVTHRMFVPNGTMKGVPIKP